MNVTKDRRFTDDLPLISISRLRATGVIAPETTEFAVRLGDVEQTVGVALLRFPNGGSWSFFLCPPCRRKARTLRLLSGQILCSRCLCARGVRRRSDPMGVAKRAALRIPKLLERLNGAESLRLKPVLWGKMERRSRHEAALQRNLAILRRHELAALAKAIDKTEE